MATPLRVPGPRRGFEPVSTCHYAPCGKTELIRSGVVSTVYEDHNGNPCWFCSATCLWMTKHIRGDDATFGSNAAYNNLFDRLTKEHYTRGSQ